MKATTVKSTIGFNNSANERLPSTKQEAITAGSDYYYPMVPCDEKGHVAPFSVSSDKCQGCVRVAAEKRRDTEELQSKRMYKKRIDEQAERIALAKTINDDFDI